jgi:hypothetical protein
LLNLDRGRSERDLGMGDIGAADLEAERLEQLPP